MNSKADIMMGSFKFPAWRGRRCRRNVAGEKSALECPEFSNNRLLVTDLWVLLLHVPDLFPSGSLLLVPSFSSYLFIYHVNMCRHMRSMMLTPGSGNNLLLVFSLFLSFVFHGSHIWSSGLAESTCTCWATLLTLPLSSSNISSFKLLDVKIQQTFTTSLVVSTSVSLSLNLETFVPEKQLLPVLKPWNSPTPPSLSIS